MFKDYPNVSIVFGETYVKGGLLMISLTSINTVTDLSLNSKIGLPLIPPLLDIPELYRRFDAFHAI